MADTASGSVDKSVQVKLVLLGNYDGPIYALCYEIVPLCFPLNL